MDIQKLQALAVIQEAGSFSRAAHPAPLTSP